MTGKYPDHDARLAEALEEVTNAIKLGKLEDLEYRIGPNDGSESPIAELPIGLEAEKDIDGGSNKPKSNRRRGWWSFRKDDD